MQFSDIFHEEDPIASLRADVDRLSQGADQFQKTLNVAMFKSLTLDWNGTDPIAITSFDHQLGYTPAYMVFYDTQPGDPGSNKQQLPYYAASGSGIVYSIYAVANNTTFSITLAAYATPKPPISTSFYVYLFREPASG